MNKGKLIVIEGSDYTGKQTQTELLVSNLQKIGYKAISFSFPNYASPTGKIIKETYLGKNGSSYFKEGIQNVEPKISSLYYAADRLYKIDIIKEYLTKNYIVVLNRYVESNMAYQGGKIKDIKKRLEMYDWLDNLEFVLLDLPRPNLVIYLYMPYEKICAFKKAKNEEANEDMLRIAESAYLELASIYDYQKVNCFIDETDTLRPIPEMGQEILTKVKKLIEEDENEFK